MCPQYVLVKMRIYACLSSHYKANYESRDVESRFRLWCSTCAGLKRGVVLINPSLPYNRSNFQYQRFYRYYSTFCQFLSQIFISSLFNVLTIKSSTYTSLWLNEKRNCGSTLNCFIIHIAKLFYNSYTKTVL